ncbi:hypothetical protein MHM98_17240 [Psychrobium sp. MM17-31]|uniref:hypothetical protein n=1 Tax=Psychrobium sp. MM17-31 TaxID=2917758 RepID=UPI001EF40326|nr:hypothetical protein [Psychrobium sp. MM17-31]MCG7533078.1 hypothetical protein [Psychrobium sp. MM17-31]
MRLAIAFIVTLLIGPLVQANTIKLNKSNSYQQAAAANAIKPQAKPKLVKKKVNNLNPIIVPKKPNLNGNYSQQLAYKSSQKEVKTRQTDDR